MLTSTSETAIRALLYLVLLNENRPVPPKEIAQQLDSSPTYMAKITGILVKADILSAQRGVHGGVLINGPLERITLLSVVEACQGKILGAYCNTEVKPRQACAFHEAMLELHKSTVEILGRWTLADLKKRPKPTQSAAEACCKMSKACARVNGKKR